MTKTMRVVVVTDRDGSFDAATAVPVLKRSDADSIAMGWRNQLGAGAYLQEYRKHAWHNVSVWAW